MIRKANKQDVEAINNLGEQLHSGFSKNFHMATEIDSNLAIVLVSESSNGINGYLYALDFGDNIDILSIFVDNMYRNKEIGSQLMNQLIELAKNKTITLEVANNNIAALSLYKKFGFKVVGSRKDYYQDADAYIMKWGI